MAGESPISETIEVRRVDRESVAALIIEAISADAYTWCALGEHVVQFSRVYRPKWATVSGWVFTIGLFGAGFWLFFIKRTETCTVSIAEGRATTRITLTGSLLPATYARLQHTLREAENAATSAAAVYDEIAKPARPASAPTRIALPDDRLNTLVDLTDARGLDTRGPTIRQPNVRRPTVRFATGQRVHVEGVIFVGRDPIRVDEAGGGVEVLALADPTGTVSKTHFAIGASAAGLWVEDLHSTNGTAIGTQVATATRLTPGERVSVTAGQTIFFGDLTAEVLAADDDRVVGSAPPSGPSSHA